MIEVILAKNSATVRMTGLRSVVDGVSVYENAATVTVAVADSDGVEVTGHSWPLALLYETGSDGNYSVALSDAIGVTVGQRYTATISANAGVGKVGNWELPIRVLTRRE